MTLSQEVTRKAMELIERNQFTGSLGSMNVSVEMEDIDGKTNFFFKVIQEVYDENCHVWKITYKQEMENNKDNKIQRGNITEILSVEAA